MSMSSIKIVQTKWGPFRAGAAVVHRGRNAHVISVPQEVVLSGEVPIMYDDEGGCYIDVPADDLNERFK